MSYFLKNTIIAAGLLIFINLPLFANDDPEVWEVDSLKSQASKRVAHYLTKKYEFSPKSPHPSRVAKLGKKLRDIGDRALDLNILDDTISFLPGHVILQLLSNNMAKKIMGEALWKKVSTHIPNGLKLKKESGYWSLSKGLGIDGNMLEGDAESILSIPFRSLVIIPNEEWPTEVFTQLNRSPIQHLAVFGQMNSDQLRSLFLEGEALPQLRIIELVHLYGDILNVIEKTSFWERIEEFKCYKICHKIDVSRFLHKLFHSQSKVRRLDMQPLEVSSNMTLAFQSLAVAPCTTYLCELNFSCDMSLEAAQAMGAAAKSGKFPSLWSLDLKKCKINAPILKALLPLFQGLNQLNLSMNTLADEGVVALATSDHTKNIRTLKINDVGLTKSAVKTLAKLPQLTNLEIGKNALEMEGIRHVGRSLTNLESLKIDDLPDNELVDLLSLPIMRGLREFRASIYEPRSERVGRALGRLGANRLRIFDIGCVKISPHDNLAISCNFNLITIPNLTLIPLITMDEGQADSLHGSGSSHSKGHRMGKGRGYLYSL